LSIGRVRRLRFLGSALFGIFTLVVLALSSESRIDDAWATRVSAVLVIVSCAIVLYTVIKQKSVFNGYTLVLGTFLLAYPLSALTHLALVQGASNGFYDMAILDRSTQAHHVYFALLLVFLGQVSLWWGLSPGRSMPKSTRIRVMPSKTLYVLGAMFTIVGIYGTYMLARESASLVSYLTTVERNRYLGNGMARYGFTSAWLFWGITFGLTAFLGSRFGKTHGTTSLFLVIAGAFCILFNMYWTGGRAEDILIALPLLMVVRKLNRRLLWPATAVIVAGVILVIVLQTTARTKFARGGFNSQVVDVFDWQMGRYSSLGLIFDMVDEDGFALGSTLLNGPAMTFNAPATLMEIPFKIPEPLPITALVGRYLYSNTDRNGVVPGTMAELYYNFGAIGVILGFYAIGKLARYCIGLSEDCNSISVYLLAIYAIVLICTWMIPMTATLALYFLATRGLPVLLLCVIDYRRGNPHPSVATYRPIDAKGPLFAVTQRRRNVNLA